MEESHPSHSQEPKEVMSIQLNAVKALISHTFEVLLRCGGRIVTVVDMGSDC